jgi:hypothetical protein
MGIIDKRDEPLQHPADPTGPQGTEDRAALVRFILGRLRSAEDARDLAQEAYLRFLQVPDEAVIRQPSVPHRPEPRLRVPPAAR